LRLPDHALRLFVAAVALTAAPTDASAAVSAQAAWAGYFHPGRATGVFLEIQSQSGGEALITVASGGQRYTSPARLEPGRLHRQWLAVVPAAEPSLQIRIDEPGKPDYREQIPLRVARRPIVAYVSMGEVRLPESRRHEAVAVDPALLPDEVGAYSTLDALVLARSGFERLSESQISTLLAFLGNCGRLLTIDIPAATLRLLRAQAGCNGLYLAAAHETEAGAAADRLLAVKSNALPSASRLATMQPESERMQIWWRVMIFVLAYVSVIALLAASGRGRVAIAAIPIVATVVALLVWTPGVREELIVWSETSQGTQFARYRGLIRVTGSGRGVRRLTLPIGGGQPYAVAPDKAAIFSTEPDRANAHRVEIPVSLMSRSLFLLEGTFPVNPALALAQGGDQPAVIHDGSRPTPEGMLSLAGDIFPLPAMQPGQTLQIDTDSPLPPGNRVGSLLRARAGERGAILLPLEQIDRLGAGRTSSVGWLMVAPSADKDESG
jgi:hypothetical protein